MDVPPDRPALRQAQRLPLGRIGGALFSGAQGFPMDNGCARSAWMPAQAQGVTCRFAGLAPGRYAVAVAAADAEISIETRVAQ
jgi:uncharacterized protein (DUF2141 family)